MKINLLLLCPHAHLVDNSYWLLQYSWLRCHLWYWIAHYARLSIISLISSSVFEFIAKKWKLLCSSTHWYKTYKEGYGNAVLCLRKNVKIKNTFMKIETAAPQLMDLNCCPKIVFHMLAEGSFTYSNECSKNLRWSLTL